MTAPPSEIRVGLSVRVDVVDLSLLSAAQLDAFLLGVAEVLAAEVAARRTRTAAAEAPPSAGGVSGGARCPTRRRAGCGPIPECP
jgi:hypothetical protein